MSNNKIMNAIVFVVIIALPLLYAGLLSSAYQDPVENISRMKAAVVNLDHPYTAELSTGESETFTLGDDLTEKLTNPGSGDEVGFDWRVMGRETAEKALKSEEIRAYMVIPEGFSRTAGSLGTDEAANLDKVTLEIVTDDGVNYLAGTMARTVAATLEGELSSQAAQQYIDTVLVAMTSVHDGFEEAADGGDMLTDGSADLTDGLTTLSDAIAQAGDGSADLKDGSIQLAEGTKKLGSAIPGVTQGASDLKNGATDLNDGAQKLASGSHTLNKGVGDFTEGADQVADGLAELKGNTRELAQGTKALAAGAKELTQGTGELTTGADKLSVGAKDLAAGGKTLAEGTAALKQGSASLHENLTSLSKGGAPLVDGAQNLNESALALLAACQAQVGAENPLCQGIAQLSEGQTSLTQGIREYQGSTAALAEGAGTLNAKIAELDKGAAGLSKGASDLSDGTRDLAAGAAQLNTGAIELGKGASALNRSIGSTKDTAQSKTVIGAINTLESGARQLSGQSGALRTGAADLDKGTGTLADGSSRLADGSTQMTKRLPALTDAVAQLDQGASALADGASRLDSGLAEIGDGAYSAVDGAQKLADGSSELTDALREGSQRVPTYSEAEQDSISKTASAIAEVVPVRDNAVANAAGGFGPMFLSLSLWIGGIALFLVMPALDRRHSTAEKWWHSATRPAAIGLAVAISQGVLAALIINWGVRLHAANLWGLVGIAVLASITFVAINQACVALLSYRGRFVSIVLLLLQITSMGGTFPIETAPRFFQVVHELLPMTWVHYGFRATIAGDGIEGYASKVVLNLLLWLVVSLVVVTVSAKARAGRRPLAHDNANLGDMLDAEAAPFGTGSLELEDHNAVDDTVDVVVAARHQL
jgi:putative membrane protein